MGAQLVSIGSTLFKFVGWLPQHMHMQPRRRRRRRWWRKERELGLGGWVCARIRMEKKDACRSKEQEQGTRALVGAVQVQAQVQLSGLGDPWTAGPELGLVGGAARDLGGLADGAREKLGKAWELWVRWIPIEGRCDWGGGWRVGPPPSTGSRADWAADGRRRSALRDYREIARTSEMTELW